MIKTSAKHTNMLHSLILLYREFLESGDEKNALKMKQLIQKIQNKEWIIAFCGHFSAGKSSMINFLLGENVLPSSPIPTSANLVKVKKGKDSAKVFFHKEEPILFKAPYEMKDLKNFCKDGDSVKEIHLSSSAFPLPENISVMDTPGIDSTDDAHRVSTESALHLADMILYVMDYNHVQSEVNFLFTKELTDAGKKLYLIVNQIDKHDESELSFKAFKASVYDAFVQWKVRPEGILFTSVRDQAHPHNELQKVKDLIHDGKALDVQFFEKSVYSAVDRVWNDHLNWLHDQSEEKLAKDLELLSNLEPEEKARISQELFQLQQQKNEMTAKFEQAEKVFYEGLEKILKNAYLMPAETRELVKAYLESRQQSFKVGLFFTKAKTDAEKEVREQKLKQSLEERAKTQLDWHLKELALSYVKQLSLQDLELESLAQSIQVSIPMEKIALAVKDQASVTGEYVLHFSNEIAELLKREAKLATLTFFEQAKKTALEKQQASIEELEQQLSKVLHYKAALDRIENANMELKAKEKKVHQILSGDVEIDSSYEEKLLNEWKQEELSIKTAIFDKNTSNTVREFDPPSLIEQHSSDHLNIDEKGKEKLTQAGSILEEASITIQQLPGFAGLAAELKEKAGRLKNQTFTIALFGAFSAGKSSFANALIGEKVLPVSPNPTTAVINKIVPPNGTHGNGTAKVKLKTESMLLADIQLAFKAFGLYPESLDEALKMADTLSVKEQGDGKEKAHLSFVAAFKVGYPQFKGKLGSELVTDLIEFQDFAANESKSCLVEEIELYWDCEMTRQGMVLVDTPGADSINARHTDAAFEYIKNSDAILFVTYYNHPFSKADREFLIQLGRVKDSFSMDKMFFLLNAVDLAQTPEELQDVQTFIKEQLLGFGIRFPRLFPISSKAALSEKLEPGSFEHHFLPDSGMNAFEMSFHHFIQHELTELVLSSANLSYERAERMLEDVILTAERSAEEKAKERNRFMNEKASMAKLLEESHIVLEKKRLQKECEELLFYARQRVFLRYGDFFKESFNPSIIKDDGRDLKLALRQALSELLESLGFDFSQEIRATSLRLEVFVQKLLAEKQSSLLSQLKSIRNSLSDANFEWKVCEIPHFKKAFEDLNSDHFKRELSLFKNPKAFFEKNEKQKMKDAIEESLSFPTNQYVNEMTKMLTELFQKYLDCEFQRMKNHFLATVDEMYEGLQAALSNHVPVKLYKDTLTKLKEIKSPNEGEG
ncbi:dynamin family protein [Peribacillus tepidiphilus]|uniref:dynamin family protein n=1 Tax=Peribacillus tepidiphilus TaxID=2652445 RepID=UPI0012918083|nr:dynamin family protein [Peribacillus tepidiphilus]